MIRSRTASAWERSRRPFRKARFVNSPRSAGRAPARTTSARTVRRISGPPWQLISSVSSPVYEWGPFRKAIEDIVEDGPRLRGDDLTVVEMMGEEYVKGPHRSEQAPGNPFRRRPADPNQADPPDAGRRRNGGYGVPGDHGIRVSLRPVCLQASAFSGPLRAGRIKIFRYSPSPRLFVVRVSSFCMAMWMIRRSWAFM